MTLFIVPTPIGNLEDITLRALRTLKEVDKILCEDTRISSKLLRAHGIATPTTSYHKFNERAQQDKLIEQMHQGHQLALISSAGTPGISDPGGRLINAAIDQKIRVSALPGPCALITALIASGFSTEPFQFWGFLDRRGQRQIAQILDYRGTSLCFESARRLEKTLRSIKSAEEKLKLFPRNLALVKELSKVFESVFWGTATALLHQLASSPQQVKGEWIIAIAPPSEALVATGQVLDVKSLKELYEKRSFLGQTQADFAKELAFQLNVKRQTIYRALAQ